MNSKNSNKKIEQIIDAAAAAGLDEAPQSTSLLEDVCLQTLQRGYPKVYTAKGLHKATGLLTPKHFSDKLWQLAQKGKVEKLPQRGYYRGVAPS